MPAAPQTAAFGAIDLGASSGRVIVGRVSPDGVGLAEVHRFPNRPVRVAGTLHWDALGLYAGILDGLRAAGTAAGRPASVGIDSWGVDFGLVDASGALLGNPVHYRDARTEGVPDRVHASVPAADLYAATGIQHAAFNTVHQLTAARDTPHFAAARHAMLIPDLISFWLTGVAGTERTNASTTQLLDPASGDWAHAVTDALGIDPALFPPLRSPGDPAGFLLPDVLAETGLSGPVPVVAVGSHDTASAVAGVPADGGDFAYISSGTWSLVGLELDAPVRTEAARAANFTNELGVDGTIRYLRNITGLWLLQECMRQWHADGQDVALADVLAEAGRATPLRSLVDAGDDAFLAPGGMPRRIADACRRTGEPVPETRGAIVRCILDSLALAYRAAIADACRTADRTVDTVHIVGGGVQNELLCRLTADACGLPVVAGPVEAAALGNILVQARALGIVHGTLGDLRSLLRGTQHLRRYEPGDRRPWDAAAERLAALRADVPTA